MTNEAVRPLVRTLFEPGPFQMGLQVQCSHPSGDGKAFSHIRDGSFGDLPPFSAADRVWKCISCRTTRIRASRFSINNR
jgi:hypothetical protein